MDRVLARRVRFRLLFFGRCNPVHPGTGHRIDPLSVLLLYGGQIIRVLHSQYIEDIFFCKVSQALPGNGFDDMLQSDVIKATILKFRLRFKFTFASGNILHQSFGVGRTIFFLQFGYRCIRRRPEVCVIRSMIRISFFSPFSPRHSWKSGR